MHLYFGDSPRTIYLVTDSSDEVLGRPRRALVFRAGSNPSQVVVKFLPKKKVDFQILVRLTRKVVEGCLGLISVEGAIFLAVVTRATDIGNTRPAALKSESVARINEVLFLSLTSSLWDDFSDETDPVISPEEFPFSGSTYLPSTTPPIHEHPCNSLTKILSSGSFYYATNSRWDLSSRLGVRLLRETNVAKDVMTFDERFIWNEFIVRSLLDFRERLDAQDRKELDECGFIILGIQGFVGVSTMALPAPPTNGAPVVTTLALISRLGRKRAGTRFNTRGVDDDGNCANFVETEILLSTNQHSVSYVQIRGSVPLFWEQQGLQTFGQRIQITRPHASQPAFERHFLQLMKEYGPTHAINLLGTRENEALLTTAYTKHFQVARAALGDEHSITHFDFHNVVRTSGHDGIFREMWRLSDVVDLVDKFGFTLCEAKSDLVVTEQRGIFRTNCLDCLDRTNFVQDILSRRSLDQYLLLARREWVHAHVLWMNHRELWAENGDALSRIYAGTGALNSSFTRSGKRTLAGVLSDATKSVSRAYISNFQDKGKQVAIDMFLGNLSEQHSVTIFDPVHDSVRTALEQRASEYSLTRWCTIFIGTWNLTGRLPKESLLSWLFPNESPNEPDLIVLGFQEIVPLTAQQIVQTDPEKRYDIILTHKGYILEHRIMEAIEHRPDKNVDYVIVRSEQLVGTALMVLVKAGLTSVIRNVEGTQCKTGLRGMSGNKGAVGIRLDYNDTSFCFLTAHLAAGQMKVDERNADFRTIVNNLHFLRGKTIASHENVIWLADANYRIDLDNDTIRSFIEAGDLDALVADDQLRKAMDTGAAFSGYQEGPLTFKPTYRYDLGTDNYDTSEKMRIPAWTDRILYRGRQLNLSFYSRAELKFSDHRPVFAVFETEILTVDAVKRAALSQLLLDNAQATSLEDDEQGISDAILHNHPDLNIRPVPRPSSEETVWWDAPDLPGGVVPASELQGLDLRSKPNPFKSPLSSPSSDEELYTHALSIHTPMAPIKRKSPPPPPPRRISNSKESFA